MTTLNTTPANQTKTAELEATLAEILAAVLRRGFYGSAGVELSVQDGTIQAIRRKVEQVQR